jgi:hypothetical protein
MTKKKTRENRKDWFYPDEKLGRGFWLEEYNMLKIFCYVPNVHKYNSVQVELTGWISMFPEVEQHELDTKISIIKKRVRNKVRTWEQNYFRKECIAAITTAVLSTTRRDYQYFNFDLTYFVNPQMIFDKPTVSRLIEPQIHQIIDEIFIEGNDVFFLVRNEKMQARAEKIKVTRAINQR